MMSWYDSLRLPNRLQVKLNRHFCELNPDKKEECEENMFNENMIIPFSMLFDVDAALFQLVKMNYNATDYWEFEPYGSPTDLDNAYYRNITTNLMLRKAENPLAILKDAYYNDEECAKQVDDLYRQILIKDYGKICGLAASKKTALVDLIIMCLSMEGNDVTILCNGLDDMKLTSKMEGIDEDKIIQAQVTLIKRVFGERYNLMFSNEEYDLNNHDEKKPLIHVQVGKMIGCEAYKDYSTIFYKNVKQIERDLDYPTETGYMFRQQTILCATYGFNMDEEKGKDGFLDLNVAVRVGITNNFGTTTIYKAEEVFGPNIL